MIGEMGHRAKCALRMSSVMTVKKTVPILARLDGRRRGRQLTSFAGEGLQATATPERRAPSGHRWKSTERHLTGLSAGRPGSGAPTEISTGPSKAESLRA